MKKNEKGLTLIELIYSIVLLTIILLFLYILINNILFKENNNEFDSSVSSALIVENVNEDLVKYGLAYNDDPNEILYVSSTPASITIRFKNMNQPSSLRAWKEEEKYKISYKDTSDKEYVYELDDELYIDFNELYKNYKENKIWEYVDDDNPDGNIIFSLNIPIYSKEGTLNTKDANDYKDDIIIEYFGKINHITQIIDDIVGIAPPVITSSDGLLSGEVHKSDFILTASGSEEGMKYYWYEEEAAGGELVEGTSITIKSETTGKKYSVKACDEEMICSEPSSYIVVYKKEEIPVPPVTPDTPSIVSSDGITTGKTHTSNFYLRVNNPQSDLTYYWSGGTSSTGTSIYISTETNGTVYYLKACNSDNVCSDTALYTVVLKKDTGGSSGGGGIVVTPPSTPTITASDGISSSSWHNSSFTLSAYSSGATSYKWSGGSTSTSSSVSVSSNTSGMTYRVQACNSGGCSAEATYTVKLDTQSPNCSISYNKSSAYGDTYTSGYWTQFNVYITLNCSDNLTSSSSLNYSVTSNTSSVSGGGSSRYISREGEHYVSISVKDAAGNSYSDSATVKIDKTAPSCSLYTTTGDYYSRGGTSGTSSTSAVYVELQCSDSLSGMTSSDKMIYKNGSASGYGSKLKMTSSGTVSYKANDIVGNSVTGTQKSVTIQTCSTSSTYTQSCSPSSTVTCSGSYTKKTTYKAQGYDPKCSWISDGTVSRTTTPSSVYSCSESYDAGNIKYTNKTCISCKKGGSKYAPSCSTPRNNTCNKWKWTVKKCKCNPKYTNYTSTYTYVTAGTCSKSGTSGTDQTYVRCTTGYTKKTTTTCS